MLAEYREQHPEASWAEIGELFNISPQRAFELYNNERIAKVIEEAKEKAA